MDKNCIDDVSKYPALIAINDMISKLPRNQQKYVRSYFTEYKNVLSNVKMIYNLNQDKRFNNYLIRIIRKDYLERINEVSSKYDINLIDHIKNYIIAKSRGLMKK